MSSGCDFSKSQSLYKGRARNFPKSQSLEGSLGVEFFKVPRAIWRGRAQNFSKSQSLYKERGRNFHKPQSLYEVRLKIFPSLIAEEEARAGNFSKSQGPYRYGKAKSKILTSYFAHILTYFRHISSYMFIFPSYFRVTFPNVDVTMDP
mgnify:CR=1 FL=1